MARKIYCQKCNKYLGEIRDATIAKGIKFECAQHDTETMFTKPKYERENVADIIGDMLRGFRK